MREKVVNGRRVCYKPKVNLSALKEQEMLVRKKRGRRGRVCAGERKRAPVRKEVGEEDFVQGRGRGCHSGIATAKKGVRKRAEFLGGNSRLCGDLRF